MTCSLTFLFSFNYYFKREYFFGHHLVGEPLARLVRVIIWAVNGWSSWLDMNCSRVETIIKFEVKLKMMLTKGSAFSHAF